MHWIQWTIGMIGHLGLWCVAFNRIHATACPRSSRKFSEKLIFLIAAIPIAYVSLTLVSWTRLGFSPNFDALIQSSKQLTFGPLGVLYARVCFPLGIYFIVRWVYRKLTFKLPAAVTETRRRTFDLRQEINKPLLHGWFARLLGAIPRNEVLQISTQEITFTLEMPTELDGWKICQLSDLHFTGQIGIEYFENIVSRANSFEPDLILITGDLVDKSACLDWLEPTLGKLRAKYGCYYVLGNHDLQIKDETTYRARLERMGLIRAADRWHSLKIGDAEIKLTGNELPWYRGAETLPFNESVPEKSNNQVLKILLSHSPDQVDWARRYDFDLMFAGHTHGGQIALPVIGPLIAPSKYGVLYAAGTFEVDGMVMHVSRGISGDEPIRFCSPPELGLFTLRCRSSEAMRAEHCHDRATAWRT